MLVDEAGTPRDVYTDDRYAVGVLGRSDLLTVFLRDDAEIRSKWSRTCWLRK